MREGREIGLSCVKFTGGEPFLHPDIMRYIEVTDRENLAVVIETNGTLLDEKEIGALRRVKRLMVTVSLDGATARIHDRFRGVEGAFERSVAALERLAGSNISTQIILSLFRDNADDLEALVGLGTRLGVASIKINPIQPSGRGQDLSRRGETLTVSELLKLCAHCREELARNFPGDLFFSVPVAFRPFAEIRDRRFSVCRIFQILGLMPNGDISFCGVGNIDESMVFGNIYKDRLADLWRGAPFLLDLRERLPGALKGVCARCILKGACLGECRATAYESEGDLMAAFWLCQQAYDAGLFPQSRLCPESC